MAVNTMSTAVNIPMDALPHVAPRSKPTSISTQAAAGDGRYGRFMTWCARLGCGLPVAAQVVASSSPVNTTDHTGHATTLANGTTSQRPPPIAPQAPTSTSDVDLNRLSILQASLLHPLTTAGGATDRARRGSVGGQTISSISTGKRPRSGTTMSGPLHWSKKIEKPSKTDIYRVKSDGEYRWIGRPHLFPVPGEANAALAQKGLDNRILIDLVDFDCNSRKRGNPRGPSIDSFDDPPKVLLEMSGVLAKDGSITLYPSIRIECAERKRGVMMQAVKKAVPWLARTTDFKYIRVANKQSTGARETKNEPALALVSRDTARLLDSLEAEFHVGYLNTTPSNESSHSLMRWYSPTVCRTTLYRNGVKIAARYSRIGGPLVIGKSQVYITTAHQIFEMILSEGYAPLERAYSQRSGGGGDTDTQIGSDSPSLGEPDSPALSEDEFQCSTLPAVDFSLIKEWNPVTLPFGARYGRLQALPAEKDRSRLVPVQIDNTIPDCAILHVEQQMQPPPVASIPTALEVDVAKQKVKILLGGPDGDEVVTGYTCAQASQFNSHSNETPTVLLSLLVALPPGSSGAWVKGEDGHFWGMIVASYQDEPMAHMIESKRLVDYVRGALPDLRSSTPEPDYSLSDHDPARKLRLFARGFMGLTRRGSATPAEESHVDGVGALADGSIVEPSQTQMQAWSEGVSNNNEGDVKAALQSREIIDLAESSSRSPSSHWKLRLRPASGCEAGTPGILSWWSVS
ncbi:hypothetical protein F5X68DRAFT_258823 [Plectosphaerella plurivora]|uniref:Uncharacterized protein n=1 Tax=Plectosphaerella plurivora TaxID=936078 RepID=A0A9P8VJN6_9PEZI|nr:hypothetical protein F5X68DRAFT_258823 [Plectosphaerella plurivora]